MKILDSTGTGQMRERIDFALDGSPDDPALLINGVRLVDSEHNGDLAYERLREVFNILNRLRDDLQSLDSWAKEMTAHLADAPRKPSRKAY